MRNLLGSCSLLLLSAAAIAQAPHPRRAALETLNQTTVVLSSFSANCPVGFSANRLPGLKEQRVGLHGNPNRAAMGGIGLRLTFSPDTEDAITEAKVVLHGMAGAHVIPAAASLDAGASEPFSVRPFRVDNRLFHSTIYTHRLTGIQWIQLKQLSYADGTVWHESAEAPCDVPVNGFLLVHDPVR